MQHKDVTERRRKSWRETELPLFEKICELYRQRLYFAEASTASHFAHVISFLELARTESQTAAWELSFTHANDKVLLADLSSLMTVHASEELDAEISKAQLEVAEISSSKNCKIMADYEDGCDCGEYIEFAMCKVNDLKLTRERILKALV